MEGCIYCTDVSIYSFYGDFDGNWMGEKATDCNKPTDSSYGGDQWDLYDQNLKFMAFR